MYPYIHIYLFTWPLSCLLPSSRWTGLVRQAERCQVGKNKVYFLSLLPVVPAARAQGAPWYCLGCSHPCRDGSAWSLRPTFAPGKTSFWLFLGCKAHELRQSPSGEGLGNAQGWTQLCNVLGAVDDTALTMMTAVLKVENMPLRAAAWPRLPGAIKPGACL